MVSLWGSKKDDDPEDTSARPQNGGESSEHAEPRVSEADERTRLLPPPSQGYLSPDDPAVSSPPWRMIQFLPLLLNECQRIGLSMWTGISVQPLERTILALLHSPLHLHNFPLVGLAVGICLHQPTWNALSRLWLLRFLIHNLDTWSSSDCPPVLLDAVQGWPDNMSGHLCHPVGRHDPHCRCSKASC